MVGSNYPPGVSAGSPRAPWNAPDHSHDHEWMPCEPDYPIFEDGAAIFTESCAYAEGNYRDGWSCEETRSMRCDVERVVLLRDGKPDVAYLAFEEDHHNEWRFTERLYEEALIATEKADRDGELDILDVDPPNKYGDGYVRVAVDGYKVVYSQ